MKKSFAKSLLTAVAPLMFAAGAFGFFAGVEGKYKGSVTLENLGTMPVTAELKGTDDKLTGTINSPQGDANIVGGSVKDGKIVLQIAVGDLPATIDGTVDDKGKILGSVSGDQLNGTIEMTPVDEGQPKS